MVAAAEHNGGIGQVNFHYIQISGSFPFLNHLKTAQVWTLGDNSNQPDPSMLDVNGYPLSGIGHDGVHTRFFIPSQHARPGRWIIKWSGNATVGMGSTFTYVSSSSGVIVSGGGNSSWQSTEGSGRVIVEGVGDSVLLHIRNVDTTISDLVFVHEDDEEALDNGEMFTETIKDTIREGNIGVIRDLNWHDSNQSTLTTWASRKPIDYVMYGGHEYRASAYNPATGSADAWSIAAPADWDGLVDKAFVMTKWNVDGTGAATVDVAGTGAKPLLDWVLNPLTAMEGDSVNDKLPQQNKFSLLIYDEYLDSWIKFGGDAAMANHGISSGAPPEVFLRIAAETGTHPYFTVPAYSLDSMTDFTFELADYLRLNKPAWMIPIFEPANEVWNSAFGFIPTRFAYGKSNAHGWGTDNPNAWYGQVLSTMGQDVARAFSVNKAGVKAAAFTTYIVVGAVQTGGDLSTTGGQAERFGSTFWLGDEVVQDGYDLDPASDWTNAFALANYYTPPIYELSGSAAEDVIAADYDGYRATVSISGTTLTISPFGETLALLGTIQAGSDVHGIGIAASLIPERTLVVSGAGDTWTLNQAVSEPISNIGIYGGLNPNAVDDYAEITMQAGGGGFGIPGLTQKYIDGKALAQHFGIQVMLGYEGGYSPDLHGSAGDAVNALRAASSQSPKIAKLNVLNFDAYFALTDETFTALYPSNYLLSSTIYPDDGNGVIKIGSIWAVLQDIYVQPRPPQWIAMVTYNKGNSSVIRINS